MGCHIWCFKRVERTQEEAKQLFLKQKQKDINDWEEIVNNPLDECRVAYKWSQEEIEFTLAVFKRQYRMVENNYCQKAIWNHQPDNVSEYINNVFYVNSEYHDVFRVMGYPDDTLYSYEECLEFIDNYNKKHNTNISVFKERLKEFWDKYPNGIIKFG